MLEVDLEERLFGDFSRSGVDDIECVLSYERARGSGDEGEEAMFGAGRVTGRLLFLG